MFDSRKEIIMSKIKNSLVAFAGLSLVIGLIALITPTRTQGQGGANQQPLNVNVINTTDAPVPVREVENPAYDPIQVGLQEADPGVIPNFTVPAGKRLVIEYVSAQVSQANCDFVRYSLTTTVQGVSLEHLFFLQVVGLSVSSTKMFGLSQQTRIYADPNTEVILKRRIDSTTGGCGFGVTLPQFRISGYLVNTP
jgi:hypothetical protein